MPGFHRLDEQFDRVTLTFFKTAQRGFALKVRVRCFQPDQGVAEVASQHGLEALRQLDQRLQFALEPL